LHRNFIQRSTLIALILFFTTFSAYAANKALEKVLPATACAPGWVLDGKIALYDKETLFERVNGEAELYFPYGFELLASARYASTQDPKIALDADVYKMGSLLDAFGMFGNYRRKDDTVITIGGEGTISSSQLFFYQDQYLVRLQVTGASSISQDVLLACGQAVSQNLPANSNQPNELQFLNIPGVVKKSERYLAQSVLGYDFFQRGLVADALMQGEKMQVFLIIEETPDAAKRVLDKYSAYLKPSSNKMQVAGSKGSWSLHVQDPLYGSVLVQQQGRFLVGVIKFKKIALAKELMEQVRQRVGK
jgi:hypothetical protein